jgi:DNA polymerase-4
MNEPMNKPMNEPMQDVGNPNSVLPIVTRKIIHIDMDAFYASVEQRDRPELRGKPIVVGGDPQSRGVVCAASYEVRKYGVRSAMSCAEAKKRCPHAIFIYPRFEAYAEASDQIMEVMKTVTDKIEPLSLDEAYLDVTENLLNERSATRIAQYLKKEIFEKTKLTASAGVSYNKFLAKIGSDLRKPNGLVVITPKDVDQILLPLPASRLWGVGKKTEEKLKAAGILTIGDLRNCNPEVLERMLGSMGPFFWELAHGRDDREVDSTSETKRFGTERTFDEDTLSMAKLTRILEELSQEIAETLQEKQWYALTFTVKVKYFDFKQITRSTTLLIPTDNAETIFQKMRSLLQEKTEAGRTPIRLLGVSATALIRENDPLQLYFEFMRN